MLWAFGRKKTPGEAVLVMLLEDDSNSAFDYVKSSAILRMTNTHDTKALWPFNPIRLPESKMNLISSAIRNKETFMDVYSFLYTSCPKYKGKWFSQITTMPLLYPEKSSSITSTPTIGCRIGSCRIETLYLWVAARKHSPELWKLRSQDLLYTTSRHMVKLRSWVASSEKWCSFFNYGMDN